MGGPYYFTAGVHLILRNKLIPNNSYVVMDDIGSTDDTALLCHTNKPSLHAFWGNWFDPNGNKVSGDSDKKPGDVPGLGRSQRSSRSKTEEII